MNTEIIKKYLAATPVEMLPGNVLFVLNKQAEKWLKVNKEALVSEKARIKSAIDEKQLELQAINSAIAALP